LEKGNRANGTSAKQEPGDDDELAEEYDVFMTPELEEKLYLLQFPTREREKPYNEETRNKPLEMRIKPQTGHVEMDVPISTEFYYDETKARAWGEALSKSKTENGYGHGFAAGFGSSAHMRRPSRRSNAGDMDISDDEEDFTLKHQTLGGQIIPDERGKPMYMIGTFRGSTCEILAGTPGVFD
jgi:DNA-directed RNA polymerase-3 subunit RPC5